MSTYYKQTKNPLTGEFEEAEWRDDYFGSHHYGVIFNDGSVVDPWKVELETRETPLKEEEKSKCCNEEWNILDGNSNFKICSKCRKPFTQQSITSKEWINEFKDFYWEKGKYRGRKLGIDEYITFITSTLHQRDIEWKTNLENIAINHAGKTPEQAIKDIISKLIK